MLIERTFDPDGVASESLGVHRVSLCQPIRQARHRLTLTLPNCLL